MSTAELQALLGYTFVEPALLERALTHTSWAHEHGGPDYERMEFLGDAVLEMSTTLMLMDHFPAANEGELSRLRARLVNTDVLAEIGRDLSLGQRLRLGRGEDANGGRDRTSILANAVEAILGAVHADGGFTACKTLVATWMQGRITALATAKAGENRWKDARSLLQEHSQRDGGQTPAYRVVHTEGPPHAPVFHVEALLAGEVVGKGVGGSKREAARAAAREALAALGATP